MLNLRRLELSGFKSFVEPVTLDFPGGMTGIVGPNGCGKSNLADAVLWVLGEQSAKTLRGTTMEDVIFNGSESRKPLGMAEVSLTFQTDPSFPAADNGMMTIGRRVFRSGESEYRLNGRRVRLREIKDLLMDTGLGIRAYSVIEQGRIGLILSGKPQERRKLLEEAAGMTRYKTRRRLAEVKLEEALANLQRLDDVIGEVERSLRSLKRQAGAARRYRQREAQVRSLLRQVLSLRRRALTERLAGIDRELAQLQDREAELTAELHRAEAELAAAREALDEAGAKVSDKHRLQAELAARIEGRQAFLRGARESVEETAARLDRGRREREHREAELEEHGRALESLAERRRQLEEERDRAASAVEADTAGLEAAEAAFQEAERQVGELRSRLLVSVNEASGARNRLHREQMEQEKAAYRLARLGEEEEQRRAEAAAAERELEEARRAAEALAVELERLESEGRRLGEERDRLREERAGVAEREEGVAEELRRMEDRRAVLAELAEAQSERRQRVAELAAGSGVGRAEFFGDALAAPPGWEEGLDRFLGELADAVVLPPGEAAEELLAAVEAAGAGAVFLQPAAAAAASDPPLDDPDIEAPLAEAVGLDPRLAAALPPAYLVADAAAARRLACRHPGVAFISRRLWARGGFVHVGSRPAGPGLLARREELRRLDETACARGAERDELARRLAELDERTAPLEAEAERLEERAEEARCRLAVARARLEDQEARRRRLSVELETLDSERQTLEQELGRIGRRIEEAEAELATAERRHGELERSFDAAQERLEAARQRREGLRTGQAGRRGRLDVLVERLESLRAEAERLEERRRGAVAWLDGWQKESAALEARRGTLGEEIRQAEVDLQSALEGSPQREGELAAAQEELEERRRRIRELDGGLAELRERREALQESIGEKRVERASVDQEATHVTADFREAFGGDPETAGADDEEAPSLDDLPRREEELAEAREALERLGPVNVLAVDELEEQERRREFLTSQRQDVAASVERLKATIREIDETSTERFQKTFREVNDHFRRTFVELFDGGEAEMRLMDEEDVLESGIEIVARPPGKRLQNMMLLSGGEKSLTAIALLFALFRTKPSPFCILDEVDAALDDANTARFIRLLQSMRGETQFLLITHNKLTMEVASTLYGVTMEEKGVSKLVSVQLDEVREEGRIASA